jgi:alkylation response protein AidB-like acyl-CoA dehydrogenase
VLGELSGPPRVGALAKSQGNSLAPALGRITVNRLLHCPAMLGLARLELQDSIAHAMRRRQFGQPIGAFRAVQHMLADMATALAAPSRCRRRGPRAAAALLFADAAFAAAAVAQAQQDYGLSLPPHQMIVPYLAGTAPDTNVRITGETSRRSSASASSSRTAAAWPATLVPSSPPRLLRTATLGRFQLGHGHQHAHVPQARYRAATVRSGTRYK